MEHGLVEGMHCLYLNYPSIRSCQEIILRLVANLRNLIEEFEKSYKKPHGKKCINTHCAQPDFHIGIGCCVDA